MKHIYETPLFDLYTIKTADIITASGENDGPIGASYGDDWIKDDFAPKA